MGPATPHAGILGRLSTNATVAVIRLRSLGDTVLTTPALKLLKQARPDIRIAAVLDTPFVDVLKGNPDVSAIIAFDRRGGWRERWGTVRRIRALRPELCLNLHGGTRSAWLTALSGARYRAGFAHFRFGFLYNVKIPRAQEVLGRGPDDSVHTAEHHASAALFLGSGGSDAAVIPRASLRAEPAGRDLVPRNKAYAVVHVTAAYATKQWAAENFRAVGESLRSEYSLDPIMIAGPGEGAVFSTLKAFDCRENLTIGELKSLIAGARLFVGNDSGPAHIAAAFGVPSVVVFGSSDSSVWRPWKTPHAVVETAWDCKPCAGDRCYAFERPRCILSVEVAQVREAIGRLLADPQRSGSGPGA